MENKKYDEFLNSFPEEQRQKVKEVADYISNLYRVTSSHIFGNIFQGFSGFIELYEKSNKTPEDKIQLAEDVLKRFKDIKKGINVLNVIKATPVEDLKVKNYMPNDSKNYIIDLEDILKEKK